MSTIPTEYEKPKATRFTALFVGLLTGLLGLAAVVWFLPVEWSEAKNRFRLWQAGARPVLWEKHRGFTLDRCEGKSPAECSCVWLIHGMGDSVSTWRKFFIDPKAFAERPVRIFAIDLPGHGGSLKRKDSNEYRVSQMAKELNAKIQAETKCEKNALIGNSFGGWVTTVMAIEAATQYSSLILIAPAGFVADTQNLFSEPTVESLKDFQKRAYYKPRELPDSVWKAAVDRLKMSPIAEIRKVQTPDEYLDLKLPKLTVPTTLIHGEADHVIERPVIDGFLRAQPKIHFESIRECGHLPQKECPEKLFPLIQAGLEVDSPKR